MRRNADWQQEGMKSRFLHFENRASFLFTFAEKIESWYCPCRQLKDSLLLQKVVDV